jgi:hypothetical protein
MTATRNFTTIATAAALAASLLAGPAFAQPTDAARAQQLAPVTVKGERAATEGRFSPFVYEALGATPRVTLTAFKRDAQPARATATSPFVYDQLGATPNVALPRAQTATDASR